jgi:hypothetical protein
MTNSGIIIWKIKIEFFVFSVCGLLIMHLNINQKRNDEIANIYFPNEFQFWVFHWTLTFLLQTQIYYRKANYNTNKIHWIRNYFIVFQKLCPSSICTGDEWRLFHTKSLPNEDSSFPDRYENIFWTMYLLLRRHIRVHSARHINRDERLLFLGRWWEGFRRTSQRWCSQAIASFGKIPCILYESVWLTVSFAKYIKVHVFHLKSSKNL